MVVRSKPAKKLLRRPARHSARSGGAAIEPVRTVARSRREGGQSQDCALYTCGCGFAFNAPVSTSVGCPHCGSTQAW